MNRLDGESYLAYTKRLIQAVEDKIITYEEFGDKLLGEANTYSAENIRKQLYFLRKFVPILESEIVGEDFDTLYKERIKLRDQRRELNKYLTSEARYEHLVETLTEGLRQLEPIQLNEYKHVTVSKPVYGCACWSDWHLGANIENGWNVYNIAVAKERANRLVDKIIAASQKHNVTDLIIEINGDMIEGEIHISSKIEAEEDTINQILIVSELLAQCINKLVPHYNSIQVFTTLGNHGRLGYAPKDNYTVKDNFEKLIPEFLRLRLGDKVKVQDSDGRDFLRYKIQDKTICLSHGQYDKLTTIIDDFAKIYKEVPDEVHVGHFHSYSDKDDCDVMVTVNGSLVGSGDFSLQCRKNTQATQVFIIYDEDRWLSALKV